MGIKLIALDIDGTLTANSSSEVPAENLAAIRRAQEAGVFVTLATGRGCIASRGFWEALNIQGPSIQFGGAWTVDTRNEHLIDSQPLAPELVQEILRYARELHVQSQVYAGNTLISEKTDPMTDAYVAKNKIPYEVDAQLPNRMIENVPKALIFVPAEDEPMIRGKFIEKLGERAHVTRSQPTFIEINAPGVSKGSALARLAKIMGIDRSEVAAVGDSYLDQDMIEWAGMGVCVEDGVPEVKAAADVIIPPCMENGVAAFIDRYVL